MQKKFLPLIAALFFLLTGYSYPQDSPYCVVNCALGNNVSIYFPENQLEYLHVGDTYIISSYSGTLYGYTGSDTRISFTTYSQPTYNSGYQSTNLNITRVIENHLFDSTKNIVNKNYEYYVLALVGGLVVLCFFKK